MEKINIAELLKDCPKGMELDCTIWDNVTFECVDDREEFSIIIRLSDGCREAVTDYGCYSDNDGAKCVIFPKGKTTWEGFKRPFKDGDILTTNIGSIFIFSHLELDRIDDRNICKAYVGIRNTMPISLFHTEQSDIFGPYESLCKFATEEEKAKLFDAIKANDYKWNPETKTLEKLIQPKFKVGDRITLKNCYKVGDKIILKNCNDEKPIYKITTVKNDCYVTDQGELPFYYEDSWKLVPNKFNITNLKPFESKVLIRDTKSQKWSPAIWGFYDSDSQDYQYKLVGVIARYCIPYEGNEDLLGKTDDCDEYFKNWK